MNVALRRPMTVEEFLAWERGQELRYEFDGVQPVAMVGGTLRHATIVLNLGACLRARVRRPCRVFGSDAKILIADRARYPDASVTCSPVVETADLVPDPVAVFEVLSASTEEVDRVVKAAEYASLPSVQHYVLLEQVRPEALVLSRAAEEGWRENPVRGLGGTVSLPGLGVSLPMAELYQDVRFDA